MKTFLLDTSLLILLIVGQASPAYIGKHKRLRDFSTSDFDLLLSLLHQASSIRLTPNTLTETSNLLKQIDEPARSKIFRKFAEIINIFDETYIESRLGAQHNEFVRMGLTDAVLLMLSQDSSLILLTTDFGLYRAAAERGPNAENFHHHREFNSS